ncbi:uncharacterized protein EV154DRAFT_575789 [Mucor mucedo]|uniref:uncharacterized protein n=1 Tax=Mucor mucedo TaxID=29922 RepID=UPI00221FC283|nr:uncharacterized protein EV154DRAFT_575789 [Mucor mucedo]KAI7880020.1 hypothetical protein EV154DRAFT_575789 [Mucor mucedo]
MELNCATEMCTGLSLENPIQVKLCVKLLKYHTSKAMKYYDITDTDEYIQVGKTTVDLEDTIFTGTMEKEVKEKVINLKSVKSVDSVKLSEGLYAEGFVSESEVISMRTQRKIISKQNVFLALYKHDDVAAQALPPGANRNNPNSKSRITISLRDTIFKPLTELRDQKPAIHRNSSYKHAMFYFIAKEFLNFIPEFKIARHARFSFGTCFGTHATDDGQGEIIEVILNDQSAVDISVNNPILIGHDRKFHVTLAVPQDNIILKVYLSKLPFLPVADRHTTLVDNFTCFGNVRDVTIYCRETSMSSFHSSVL